MKRPSRTTIIVSAIALACVLAGAASAALWANDLQRTANAGKAQALLGLDSLASRDATSAVSRFGSAQRAFARAQSMLGPDWLGGAANVISQVGRQYSAARTLVAIGLDGSTAGVELAEALQGTASAPATATSNALATLLATRRVHVDAALVALTGVADRSAGLTAEGLVAPLAKAARAVKKALLPVAPFLRRSHAFLSLERYLLSSQRRILVISQNSTELRPTGGFAGSFGILDVGPQGVTLERYADVYTMHDPRGHRTPPPGAVFTRNFGFRNANWWMDYPTSARTMLALWHGGGQEHVDAIVVLDVVTVRDLLEVVGPVSVPSYSETFTAANLLNRLLYLIEDKSAGLRDRKDVLVALASELEKRLVSADTADLSKVALALARSADEKHVQLYFTDATAQAAVTALGWSGALAPPAGTTDVLAVSNAGTLPSKSNGAMRKTIDYRVALAPDGSAETTLVLGYANTGAFAFPPTQTSTFGDYLRVYRSPGTVLLPATPHAAAGSSTTVEAGLPAVVRTFSVGRGHRHEEVIVTRVPGAWRTGLAAAIPGSPVSSVGGASASSARGVAYYRLSLVRQADIQDVPTMVTVTLPAGWRVSGANAWRKASGEALAVTWDPRGARLALPLSSDVVFDVGMVRP
jgi:hypothetical protein